MEYENALFIGGAADGERRAVEVGRHSMEVPVFPRMPERMTDHSATAETAAAYRVEQYIRQRVRNEKGEEFAVYVAGGVDLIRALLNGYRQPK